MAGIPIDSYQNDENSEDLAVPPQPEHRRFEDGYCTINVIMSCFSEMHAACTCIKMLPVYINLVVLTIYLIACRGASLAFRSEFGLKRSGLKGRPSLWQPCLNVTQGVESSSDFTRGFLNLLQNHCVVLHRKFYACL